MYAEYNAYITVLSYIYYGWMNLFEAISTCSTGHIKYKLSLHVALDI